MKKILTYGTFDLLHYGHIEFLKKAKHLGDYLIVGLSSDAFNETKGKKSYYSYNERKKILSAIKYVDKIIVQNSFEQKKEDIKKYGINTLVSSEDWQGKYDYLKSECKVVYFKRVPEISTSKIKFDLKVPINGKKR